MGWVQIAFAALSFAVRLIPVAEKAFDGKPDSGKEKKEMVMSGTKALVDTMEAVSTGGQAETWNRIEKPVGDAIDAACTEIFKE